MVHNNPTLGRRHQLRLHAKGAGHPIVGDVAYCEDTVAPRMMLHAWRLRLPLPTVKGGRRRKPSADAPTIPLCVSTADPFPCSIMAAASAPTANASTANSASPTALFRRIPALLCPQLATPSPPDAALAASPPVPALAAAAVASTASISFVGISVVAGLVRARRGGADSTVALVAMSLAAAVAIAAVATVIYPHCAQSDSPLAAPQSDDEQVSAAAPASASASAASDLAPTGAAVGAQPLVRVAVEGSVQPVPVDKAEASFDPLSVLRELRAGGDTAPEAVIFRCVAPGAAGIA